MYSHVGSATGTGFDMTPNGWMGTTITSAVVVGIYDPNYKSINISTNLGTVWLAGISGAVLRYTTSFVVPSNTASHIYTYYSSDENGISYYAIPRSATVERVYFDGMDVIFDNNYGSGGGKITIVSLLGLRPIDLLSATAVQNLDGTDGADVIKLNNVANSGAYADNGNDLLYGGSADNDLAGEAGNDTVYGLGGNDYIKGDNDLQELKGPSGGDSVLGGTGDDTLNGGIGNDSLDGGKGKDVVVFDTDFSRGRITDGAFAYLGNHVTASDEFEFISSTGVDVIRAVETVEFNNGNAPLRDWYIRAERGQDGTLSSVVFYENGKIIARASDPTLCAYDDATPLLAGIYDVALRINSSQKTGTALQFLDAAGRNTIQMHIGNYTTNSEGCLVVQGDFYSAVWRNIFNAAEAAGMVSFNNLYQMPVPIHIEYVDIAGAVMQPKLSLDSVGVSTTDRTEVVRPFSLNLSRTGTANDGITKWIEVVFKVSGTANAEDYQIVDSGQSNRMFQNARGYHVFIDPGQISADLGIKVLANASGEAKERINIDIVDINLFNAANGGKAYAENRSNILYDLFLADQITHFTLSIAADLA